MTLEQYVYLADILGNVTVVGSLVYLVVQVSQVVKNDMLTRSSGTIS